MPVLAYVQAESVDALRGDLAETSARVLAEWATAAEGDVAVHVDGPVQSAFVRHQHPVAGESETFDDALEAGLEAAARRAPATVGVHAVRLAGAPSVDLGARLAEHGATGATIVSLAIAPKATLWGVSPVTQLPTEWPAGRIRLSPEGHVSRAALKLEEAFAVLHPPPASRRGMRAVDLGAAPGGFTQVLRARGFHVIAIDPSTLHPAVEADEGVRHERRRAEDVRLARDSVDLLTCDVNHDARRTAETLLRFAPALRPGALAYVTVKLPAAGRRARLAEVRAHLASAYTEVAARQLFHNRGEVTVVLRRPA